MWRSRYLIFVEIVLLRSPFWLFFHFPWWLACCFCWWLNQFHHFEISFRQYRFAGVSFSMGLLLPYSSGSLLHSLGCFLNLLQVCGSTSLHLRIMWFHFPLCPNWLDVDLETNLLCDRLLTPIKTRRFVSRTISRNFFQNKFLLFPPSGFFSK